MGCRLAATSLYTKYSKMKKIFKYFLSVGKALNILLLISFLCIFSINFVFDDIPELFYGGYKIGVLVENLSLAFIASYIFFFIVIHIKLQRDREIVYRHVQRKIYLIINDAQDVIKEMAKISKTDLMGNFPTKNELLEICSKVNPQSDAPLLLSATKSRANWIKYLDYLKQRSDKHILEIYTFIQYLDAKIISQIFSIQDCSHFKAIDFVSKVSITNTDFSDFASGFEDYFNKVNELKNYSEKFFAGYFLK